jgi:hypothetical protein
MGDAGEGLIDADARIQERMEELERERSQKHSKAVRVDPEHARALESLRLARTELDRQLTATTHERRRAQLADAIKEVERRIVEASAKVAATSH